MPTEPVATISTCRSPVLQGSSMNLSAAWPWRQALPSRTKRESNREINRVQQLLAVGSDKRNALPVALPPSSPVQQNPRITHNAASLAYIGDAVYELYARSHFFTPPQTLDKYSAAVTAMVCCEAQDTLLQQLLKESFLSEEERSVLRWGKNVVSSHKRATKRAGTAVYSAATSLETLIGYLYLSDPPRLRELMAKLGFNDSKQP